jgi:alpha-L-rhamnosidase
VRALPPRAATAPTPGAQVFDFGQNLAGVVRLRLRAGQCARGANVTIRHGEALMHPPYGAADGTLYTANLRGAKATDVYTCAGGVAPEEYAPTFTQVRPPLISAHLGTSRVILADAARP